jgi:ClpP class serine protease
MATKRKRQQPLRPAPHPPVSITSTMTATSAVANSGLGSLIDDLERERKSRVIVFATGDRQRQETQIGQDVLPVFYDHLISIGAVDRIDLVVYSRGGDTLSGFTLANALREFGKHVAVLVPFRAHSCATLISLAADEIVMGPLGQLSPIDPSITSPHGPFIEENGKKAFLPMSVEDVANYLEMARKEAGISSEEHMAAVLGYLAEKVSPLALGAIYRAREQIGMLADKLLVQHMADADRRKRIVKVLTRELGSHDYILSRREARDIGMSAVDATDEEARLLWAIYQAIAADLQLNEFFRPAASGTFDSRRGLLQSRSLRHAFVSSYQAKTTSAGPSLDTLSEGWRLI